LSVVATIELYESLGLTGRTDDNPTIRDRKR